MDRTRNTAVVFGVNFLLGYLGGRLFGDRSTGIRAGLALGAVGAVGSWRLSGEFDGEPSDHMSEPIEIEIDE